MSVHCHNDLGLATSNTLAAIRCGANQVECTVKGIGERAGNAAMEEVVAAIKTRSDIFDAYTDIDTRKIKMISRKIEYQLLLVIKALNLILKDLGQYGS